MSDESERLITTYFHKVRSEAKHKPSPGVDKIVEAMRGRVERSQLEADRARKPE